MPEKPTASNRRKKSGMKKQGKITCAGKVLYHKSGGRCKRKRLSWAHGTNSPSRKFSRKTTAQASTLFPALKFKGQGRAIRIGVDIEARKAVNVKPSMRSDRLHPVQISVVNGATHLTNIGIDQLTVQGDNVSLGGRQEVTCEVPTSKQVIRHPNQFSQKKLTFVSYYVF